MALKPKHIPLRRCVVCRESKPQAELLRFVKSSTGQWQFDEAFAKHKRKSAGRGAWLCKLPNCHSEKALKRFFRQESSSILSATKAYLASLEEPTKNVTSGHVKSKARRIRIAKDGGMNV